LSSALFALVGCGSSPEPELVLAVPGELRAFTLGPVEGAPVVLDDGTEPDGVIWTVAHPEVADVQGNRVIAVGPGETAVHAEWEGVRVGFRVIVTLDTQLTFVDAPASLRVGEARALSLVARVADRPVDPGPVSWSSSDPEVVRIDAGTVHAVLPGTAWVVAKARGASAMLELEVVP
jgi:hypothetical protein